MGTTQLKITGIACEGGARHVEKLLKSVSGVQTVRVALTAGQATPERTGANESDTVAAIADAGYPVEVVQGSP